MKKPGSRSIGDLDRTEDWFELFNRHDPCGLIGLGAPSDEYSSEVAAINQECKNCNSEEDLKMLVWCVFTKSMGQTFPVKKSCDELASELWQRVHED